MPAGLLTVHLSDAAKAPRGSVQLTLDWTRREWQADTAQPDWGLVGFSARGPFEERSNNVLWLWDHGDGPTPRNTLILWEPPTGPLDILHFGSGGQTFDPKSPALKGGAVQWSRPKPTAGGGLSPLRAKALAILADPKHMPPFPQIKEPRNFLVAEEGKKKLSDGTTGCGQLPGWLVSQLGAGLFYPDKVSVTIIRQGKEEAVTARATKDMTTWEDLALGLEKKYKRPGQIWHPFVENSADRPKPGDIYLLKGFLPKPLDKYKGFRHVGVVVDASGPVWRTADAGQGKGLAVGYNARKFSPDTGEIRGENNAQTWVKGWVDLEGLQPGGPVT